MLPIELEGAPSVDVDSLVRLLPDKREVVKGSWAGRPVYAKRFIGQHAKRYFERDLAGVHALQEAHLLTPRLLFSGTAKNISSQNSKQSYVLVFEAIEPASNADIVWQQSDIPARLSLALSLVKALASHHQHGLLQTDLHLKNFLVSGKQIYTLDGDGIRRLRSFLTRSQVLNNLAVLLSKLGVLELEANFDALLDAYIQARGWSSHTLSLSARSRVKCRAVAHRSEVASHYADEKVFRSCTDVNVRAKSGQFVAIAQKYENAGLDLSASTLDALLRGHLLKNGRTATVGLILTDETERTAEPLRLVVKRYNIKNLSHKISRSFRPTRAAISWANAYRLKLLGIATAEPVALIEQRLLGMRGKAYFIAELIDAPDADAYFVTEVGESARNVAVGKIVQLCYQLYLLRISHGDLKASNIKMSQGQPVLIDLDSMKQHTLSWISLSRHARDLRRLMRNWQDRPALQAEFVKEFKRVYADQRPLELANIISRDFK